MDKSYRVNFLVESELLKFEFKSDEAFEKYKKHIYDNFANGVVCIRFEYIKYTTTLSLVDLYLKNNKLIFKFDGWTKNKEENILNVKDELITSMPNIIFMLNNFLVDFCEKARNEENYDIEDQFLDCSSFNKLRLNSAINIKILDEAGLRLLYEIKKEINIRK